MKILDWIKLTLIVVVFAVFVYVVWDYQATKVENERLTKELLSANSTITALDQLVIKKQAIQDKTDALVDEIDKEPETNDAITAPVLFNSIKRLR